MGEIVVIRGAGAGVGRATATEFARIGCDVALLSRNPERLEPAAAELRHYGVRALPVPTDTADYQAVEAATERVESELGPINVWVNVAMATVFDESVFVAIRGVNRSLTMQAIARWTGNRITAPAA